MEFMNHVGFLELYRDAIFEFLDGREPMSSDSRWEGSNIWVARHNACHALTIEPNRTSQYEAAVMLPADDPDHKWGGFYAQGNKLVAYRMYSAGHSYLTGRSDRSERQEACSDAPLGR